MMMKMIKLKKKNLYKKYLKLNINIKYYYYTKNIIKYNNYIMLINNNCFII